jgi:hypothetical protein
MQRFMRFHFVRRGCAVACAAVETRYGLSINAGGWIQIRG